MRTKISIKEKLPAFLAGVGSAAVMLLAFLIPSMQDQWDRYQSRKVITQYENLGNDFYSEERYDMAEQAYQKAFELSENKRLDIDIKRLDAKINRINIDPKWGAAPPEDLEEIDFQYLLHLQKGKEKEKERVTTLNSYGVFLAALKKYSDATRVFKEAIQIDSNNAMSYVNLGNLYDQQRMKEKAENNYRKAIALEKGNGRAHYNLGLLYTEQGKLEDARRELKIAVQIDSADPDAIYQYNQVIQELKGTESE